MKKIGDITNTADKNGEFTDGNVAAGTPPTQLMGAWFNSVQREILNVLVKAGIPQSATKEDQLVEAITKMIAGAGYLPAGYSYSKTESDTKYATNTALTNGLNTKLNTSSVAQSKGSSETHVMSQKIVTDELNKKQIAGNYADKSTSSAQTFNSQIESYAGEVAGSYTDRLFISIKVSNGVPEIMHRAKNSEAQSAKFQNKSGVIAYLDDINKAIPIGSSMFWNSTAPIPENFWPNEGRSFSASEYPELAKIFTNLKLPDDRGYAIRIADNGRGIDAGRAVGTYQEDAIRNITGVLNVTNGISEDLSTSMVESSGAFKTISSVRGNHNGATKYTNISKVAFEASNQVPTASENRMKNVAKILITRMK